MMDHKSRELLENTFTQARWLATAFIGSLFVEAVMVEMLLWFTSFTGFIDPETGLPASLQYVLLVAGLSDLVFLPFLRRSLLATRRDSQPAMLISRLMSATIVTLAISIYPALLGLVIYLLWGGRLLFYPLWSVSLALLLIYFPRQSFWEEWVEGRGRMEV